MGVAIPGVLGAGAVGAIAGAVGAWWLHRRTRLSALNVYVFAPVGVAVFVGALATLQGALVAATAPFGAAGVVGAAIARRLRLAALGAGGELREFEQARVMLWTAIAPARRGRCREVRQRGGAGEDDLALGIGGGHGLERVVGHRLELERDLGDDGVDHVFAGSSRRDRRND